MFGIFLGLALLMILAYRGMSIIWIAPICALVVGLTGGLDLLPMYTDTYMTGFVGFTKSWFPTFMLGAIFGKIMDESGGARSIASWIAKVLGAKRAMLAIVLGCAVLTYGGISLFVVVFAVYPLALALFREANITRKLIPGAIALGAFGFTMTAVPGSPQIQNLIPMKYFGTTATAAPVLGIVATISMLVFGMLWLSYREKQYTAKGEGFVEPDKKVDTTDHEHLMNPALAILPLIIVVVVLNVLKQNIVVALAAGIIAGIAVGFSRLKNLQKTINDGAAGSVLAIINTSAAVGFGSVVRAVPGFKDLTNLLLGIQGNILISEAVAVNALAGATGSASGGMGIALEALGAKYMELATTTGVSPEALHRIASLSSGGLDTLPHNGAVLTLLAVTGLTHKDSYLDIMMTSLVNPVIATVICIILYAGFGIL
ncbi:GntP family permease [Youngiibacter fragilis]|uniref:Citrate transporter n=1 Tax=Youngiibacter fragilis 232.1 TaxID=994573 RepID=V7I953_9CLOT|nr:GntP family permease [Youngiibacter fragilis]ETA81799.1 citrate transporter [Youngiibacter fragilis 232.1]